MISNSKAKVYISILSVVVIGLVFIMQAGFNVREWFDVNYSSFDKYQLPFYNACINFSVFVTLLFAYYSVINKRIETHRKAIYLACILSTLFLLNYVFYHMISDSTKYGGVGILKGIYFFILLTHIVLSAVSFPFILYTAFLGQTMQKDSHRRLAKYVFPVWTYVALTGVIVYIMISPYYGK